MHLTRRHFCGMSCSALALSASGCAVNPATGQRNFMLMSYEEEKAKGAELHPQVIEKFGGAYNDPGLAQYVNVIGGRLAHATEQPGRAYTFTVLDSPVVNAFALPGGYIYITRGLMALAESEAELASVLGHELGHVVARHAAQRYSRGKVIGGIAGVFGAVTGSETVGNVVAGIGNLGFVKPFSRDQELEADRLGVRYIKGVGYDPGAMTVFLAKMRENSRLEAKIAGRDPDDVDSADVMSTHPRTADRVRRAMKLAGATAGQGAIERDAYLRRIDKMVYGDAPSQGFARGRVFAHPVMRMRFEAPKGFRIRNSPAAVVAVKPGKMFIIFDAAEKPYKGRMTGYLANEWAKDTELENLKAVKVNGLAAATAITTVAMRGQKLKVQIAAIRFNSKRIYRFTGLAPADAGKDAVKAFQHTINSFRRMSAAEAKKLKPWRLRIVTVRSSDTAFKLSRRFPFDSLKKERFMVMNGLGSGRSLRKGAKVKLIAAK